MTTKKRDLLIALAANAIEIKDGKIRKSDAEAFLAQAKKEAALIFGWDVVGDEWYKIANEHGFTSSSPARKIVSKIYSGGWDEVTGETTVDGIKVICAENDEEMLALIVVGATSKASAHKAVVKAADQLGGLPEYFEEEQPAADERNEKINIDGKFYTPSEFQNLKNLKVVGDLDLRGTKVTSLPDGLEVSGYLDLKNTKITSLPAGLKVGKSLFMSFTNITSLPDGLKVGGNLILSHTKISSLPADLKVGKFLDLSHTKVTSLPANLKVGGSLDLSHTKVTSLPAGLKVGWILNLGHTKVTSLPADLKVDGHLYLKDSPLAGKITSHPGVRGTIYISKG